MLFNNMFPKQLPLSQYEKKMSDNREVVEEGLIEYLLEVIPPKETFCIEFGAQDGLGVHVKNLIRNYRFSALLIEADEKMAELLKENYKDFPTVNTVNAFLSRDNIEHLFSNNNVPKRPYMLVIDIDGNDYHIWQAIKKIEPIFVSIEFNASYGPSERFVIDYDENFRWSGDDYFGASIRSMVELGRGKGYELLHCTSGGDNLYFVRKEFFPEFNIEDNSIDAMYQLPQYGRYGRSRYGKGHPTSKRNSRKLERIFNALRYYVFSIPRAYVKKKLKN